jgi:transposase
MLGIDKAYIGRRGKCITVVVDIESGDPVSVGVGKAGTAANPLREMIGRRRKRIEAVAIDMSPAFMMSIRENLPNATVIFDHFHVARLMNDLLLTG